jgi:hypothetical protein
MHRTTHGDDMLGRLQIVVNSSQTINVMLLEFLRIVALLRNSI